ncbi:aminotransferase class IV family protein [Runella sp.]|uniref:aminotransferase class IV family protein n=1 Tax=Runella sp. TaxID=1960881 RepID=UPI003D10126C
MNSPLCIETIRLADGQLSNLPYHNERLNRTRFACFGETMAWDLNELIKVPSEVTGGIYKCRFTYGKVVEKIEFEPYQPRIIKTLRMVEDTTVLYEFKFQDRSSLQRLFEKRENADDVLIVKNGLITDSSYANVVFWDGSQWFTPNSPLLKGTKRAQLLEEGIITEQKIRVRDISNFTHVRLINAMLDFGSTPLIEVSQISS